MERLRNKQEEMWAEGFKEGKIAGFDQAIKKVEDIIKSFYTIDEDKLLQDEILQKIEKLKNVS